MPPPGRETRYSTHMKAVESDEFEMTFFTWRHALLGRYDLFHSHWPEHLLGPEDSRWAALRWALVRALLVRLRLTRTPVVSTIHNRQPHDRAVTPRLSHLSRALDARTAVEIHLVPEPDRRSAATATFHIPHGDYRDAFAEYAREQAVPGRIITFGLLKRYKGIERLLDVFARIPDDTLTLRIVGEPSDPSTVAAIESAASSDTRVSRHLAFVSDEQLVQEVTRSEIVVLPYVELHSSGAALVALSLDRPVLIPESDTAIALREEVGEEWVSVFTPPLTADALRAALDSSGRGGHPDLRARVWTRVRQAHTEAYRCAISGSRADIRSASSSTTRSAMDT